MKGLLIYNILIPLSYFGHTHKSLSLLTFSI